MSKVSMKDKIKSFMRLSHIDPVEGIPEIEQSDEVRELVGEIKNAFERRKEERRPFELQWRLNQNFLRGNQYCDVVEETGEISDYPTTYDHEMRSVYNQLAPIAETRLSKLARVQPGLTVRPVTSDTDDVTTAKVSTRLLSGVYATANMKQKGFEANTWAEYTGGVFFKTVWNPYAGRIVGYRENKPVYEGDVSVTVIPYYEMFPDSSYHVDIDSCDNLIHAKVYSVGEIKLRWGLDVAGRELNVFSMDASGMSVGGVGYNPSMMQVVDQIMDDSELVLEYFEKPNKYFPEGRHVIIIGDTCVHLGVLPYKCGEYYRRGYPFVHQRCLFQPGILWGSSVVERCIPLQRDYNALKNRINEYSARMVIGNMVLEEGSLVDEDVLDTGLPPGTPIMYRQGHAPPQWMQVQEIPMTLINQVQAIEEQFVTISGVSEMARTSQTPAAISSGTALEILKEQDDTRLALTAENIRNAYACMGQQWLRIMKQFATVPRISRVVGNDAGDVMSLIWTSSDITSDDVIVDTDNEMTNTPAQRKQLAMELMNAGMFIDPDSGKMTRETRAKLMELFQLGNWEAAIDIDEQHTVRAQRENLQLERSTKPEVMQLDDHGLHIAEHIKYALSAEYRKLSGAKPELGNALLSHIEEHKAIAAEQAMALSGQGGAMATQQGESVEAAMNADAQNTGALGAGQ